MAEITLLATWVAQDNADGYRVRLLDAQGAQLELQDVATTSTTFGPLDELTTYQVELVAYHSAEESDPQLLSVTTPEGEEGGSSLMVAWEDPASGDTARLLDEAGAELQDLGAVTSPITLTGLTTGTAYQFELTRADATVEVIDFTTPIGLPGGVSGIQHTFTTDSLTFTWDAAAAADEYRLTLSLDGAEVATQTVTDLTATFDTLEDGTQYDLAIQASNTQGDGPIAYYQATTGYIAPAAPTNLRQFEERIIAVICRWDHPEPDKVHDTEVQLLYGDELVGQDALDGAATERTIIVPMASTDYLLRVRAGNPGGWSAWAEATVHSEKFPLIDSRLGVMGATYLEDVLHPDTWDGGTDLDAQGVGDPQRIDGYANFDFIQFGFVDPVIVTEDAAMTASASVRDFSSRVLQHYYTDPDNDDAMTADAFVRNFSSRDVKFDYEDMDNDDAMTASAGVRKFVSVQKLFLYTDSDNDDAMTAGDVVVRNFTSSV